MDKRWSHFSFKTPHAMRADQWLLDRGLAASRSQAQRLLATGARWRLPGGAWRPLAKGDALPPGAEVELLETAEARYVSRGGLKLEGALAATGVAVAGRRCLDAGQSTGGFTDCLLQHGAAQVVGVDVGHDQLHPSLRVDARVCCIERVNVRFLDASQLIAAGAVPESAEGQKDACFDVIVGDLSFISLTRVLPALAPLLAAGGDALLLVKPQFELQPGQIGKGGIVRDAGRYAAVEQRLRIACREAGWSVRRWLDSPIAGGDGNREFFIHAVRPGAAPAQDSP